MAGSNKNQKARKLNKGKRLEKTRPLTTMRWEYTKQDDTGAGSPPPPPPPTK